MSVDRERCRIPQQEEPSDCALCGRVTYAYTFVLIAGLDFPVCWQCRPKLGEEE